MNRTLLIDGDIVLFRVASSLSGSFDFGGEILTSVDLEGMIERTKDDIAGILRQTGCKDYIFVLSGSKNYRKEFFPSYKTNRKSSKPEGYNDLKEWAENNLPCKINAKLEGDDVMGIYATKYPEKYAIFSIDKDMKTIPTTLWCFKEGEFYEQSKLEALRFLYSQVLMGDATDGYKGCPRVGKVGAEKLLGNCKDETELLLATLQAYFKYYGYGYTAISHFLEQMGQARILHYSDWLELDKNNSTYNPTHLLRSNDGKNN